MIREDRDALICDMAETYHVYDMWSLPVRTVAALASGLRGDSRIRRKMSGRKASTELLMMAGIMDRLSILIWQQTRNGMKGWNRPPSLVELILQPEEKEEMEVFDSGDEFDRRWAELTGR